MYLFTDFVNLHNIFHLGKCFSAQTEVMHKVKVLYLPKLAVQIFMITSYTSEACEYISCHYSVTTLEINEIASCAEST